MSEIKSDPRLEAWRLFITLHAKIIEIIDADIQAAGGIPLQHYDVLIELFEAEGKQLRMYDLARRVALSRSSITRFVDQLAQQEFLTRRTDPEDRRGSYAVLTEAGEAALRESWPAYREAIERHFGSFLNDAEAALIVQGLGRIHAAINNK
jgi:DNA-binding MarR family transcriptional regulator